MNCPVCNVQLAISERQGIEIDYCPKCRGVWLDRGELDKIIELSSPIASKTTPHRTPYEDRERYDDHDHEERGRHERDDHYERGRRNRRSFWGDIFGGDD
jgi:uncharacterized protein